MTDFTKIKDVYDREWVINVELVSAMRTYIGIPSCETQGSPMITLIDIFVNGLKEVITISGFALPGSYPYSQHSSRFRCLWSWI